MTNINTTPTPSVARSIERQSVDSPVVYPLVGEYILVDQGDSAGCVEYSGEVTAVEGTVVTIDGIKENLDDVAFWATLTKD